MQAPQLVLDSISRGERYVHSYCFPRYMSGLTYEFSSLRGRDTGFA
jgi:hypothetical protein